MFLEILKEIVEDSGGGIGAVLMGYDGIAVEQYFTPVEGVDLQLVAVEYANVLKEIKNTADILEAGRMEEVSIKTEKYHVLIRTISDEYFVALTMNCDSNHGKGRYLLTRDSGRLLELLA